SRPASGPAGWRRRGRSAGSGRTARARRAPAARSPASAGRRTRRARLPGRRCPLRKDPEATGERDQPRLAVVEPDGLLAVPRHVRRIDLETHEEDVAVARADAAELEREPPVVARLADGARLDRVDLHPLGPAGTQHEVRVLDVPARGDVEPGVEEQAAAQPRRPFMSRSRSRTIASGTSAMRGPFRTGVAVPA